MPHSDACFGRLDVKAPRLPEFAKESVKLDREGRRILGCDSALSEGLSALGVCEDDVREALLPLWDMECIVSGLEKICDRCDQSRSERNGSPESFLPGVLGKSSSGIPPELAKSWSYPQEVADRMLFGPLQEGLGRVDRPVGAAEPHVLKGALLCRAGAVRCCNGCAAPSCVWRCSFTPRLAGVGTVSGPAASGKSASDLRLGRRSEEVADVADEMDTLLLVEQAESLRAGGPGLRVGAVSARTARETAMSALMPGCASVADS